MVLERFLVEMNPLLSVKHTNHLFESSAQFDAQTILPGGEGPKHPVCRMTSCQEAKTKKNNKLRLR